MQETLFLPSSSSERCYHRATLPAHFRHINDTVSCFKPTRIATMSAVFCHFNGNIAFVMDHEAHIAVNIFYCFFFRLFAYIKKDGWLLFLFDNYSFHSITIQQGTIRSREPLFHYRQRLHKSRN